MQSVARFFAVFALVFSIFACSSAPKPETPVKAEEQSTYLLHVDDLYTPAEKAIIVDSFAEWERDTHGVVKFKVSKRKWNSDKEAIPESVAKCTYEVYVLRVKSKDKVVLDLEKKKSKEHGWPFTVLGFASSNCEQRLVALVMDRLTDRVLLRQVTVHEAGHLIGLDHTPVPKMSVMFPSVDKGTKCPTKFDMMQLCDQRGCKWQDMTYCDAE